MIKISPSLLSADFSSLMDDIKRAAPYCEMLHVDVMDGHFVPNITIGLPVVKAIKRALDEEGLSLQLDVHLMIENPDDFIPHFAAAGADIIAVHAETCNHLHRTLALIREHGAAPAVALNPATPLCELNHIFGDLDMIVIMSVNPGFGGQSFITSALPKIHAVKAMADTIAEHTGKVIDIEVDGGVTPDNVADVVAAGANVIVAGSAVFGNIYAGGERDIEGSLEALRKAAGETEGEQGTQGTEETLK